MEKEGNVIGGGRISILFEIDRAAKASSSDQNYIPYINKISNNAVDLFE